MLIFVPTGVAKLPKAQTREGQLVALRRQHQSTLLELMGTPPLTPGGSDAQARVGREGKLEHGNRIAGDSRHASTMLLSASGHAYVCPYWSCEVAQSAD